MVFDCEGRMGQGLVGQLTSRTSFGPWTPWPQDLHQHAGLDGHGLHGKPSHLAPGWCSEDV